MRPPIVSWLRPMRPFSRPAPFAASVANRPTRRSPASSSPNCEALRLSCLLRRQPKTSSDFSLPPARCDTTVRGRDRFLLGGTIMAADQSFDIVSKVDIQEVKNAIDQASKELHARFDLKNSKSSITLEGNDAVQLASQDEYTLKAVIDILQQKLVKRSVPLKNLEYEKVEPAAGSTVRQKIKLKQGIAGEVAKKIVALIKDSKKKAQASIQGDTVRVSSKDRDTLQEIIAMLRGKDMGVDLQFTNFRSS